MMIDDKIMDSGLFSTPGDKILLPLMGYPFDRDAMFLALVTAEYFGADLYVLHITRQSKKTAVYLLKELDWLKQKSKELNVKLEITIKESKLRTDDAIIEEIKVLAPRLTIMMSRKRIFFQRLIGSIAERVARKSPYSVMIIRTHQRNWVVDESQVELKKIVVPLGTNQRCEVSAVQIAIALANAGKSRDADVTLLHVIIVPETVPIIADDDKILIKEEKNFVKQAGMLSTMLLFPMNTKVVVGRDIGRSISQYLNKEEVDLALIAVEYVPRRFFGLFGTDTNEIYHKSKCPVAVIFHKEPC
ncbi:MAG: universal stress protein [Asgard group archaeon]|nr:universal stress protein [Asgard group archaeon]